MFIFQADSLDSVRMAAERGALSFEHVAQADMEAEDGPGSGADGSEVPLP